MSVVVSHARPFIFFPLRLKKKINGLACETMSVVYFCWLVSHWKLLFNSCHIDSIPLSMARACPLPPRRWGCGRLVRTNQSCLVVKEAILRPWATIRCGKIGKSDSTYRIGNEVVQWFSALVIFLHSQSSTDKAWRSSHRLSLTGGRYQRQQWRER